MFIYGCRGARKMSSLNMNVLQAVNGFNLPESQLQVWMAHQNPPKTALKKSWPDRGKKMNFALHHVNWYI